MLSIWAIQNLNIRWFWLLFCKFQKNFESEDFLKITLYQMMAKDKLIQGPFKQKVLLLGTEGKRFGKKSVKKWYRGQEVKPKNFSN